MKTTHRLFSRLLLLGLTVVLGCPLIADDVVSIINPAKRVEALENAKALLATKPALAQFSDPFHPQITEPIPPPDPFKPVDPLKRVDPIPRKSVIQAIGATLNPSGFFVMGGEPTLVFGQKRVKAGGFLTITFEGADYTLEIISINRPNFTFRLNREEFTRPIK